LYLCIFTSSLAQSAAVFPYTTLFRSCDAVTARVAVGGEGLTDVTSAVAGARDGDGAVAEGATGVGAGRSREGDRHPWHGVVATVQERHQPRPPELCNHGCRLRRDDGS